MKKQLMAVLILLLTCSVYTLEVDRTEITPEQGQIIDFINYTGPVQVFNTAKEIEGIGVNLGTSIGLTNLEQDSRAGNENRYAIIHAVDPSDPKGFDADILIIGAQAQIDHIDNIRRIISAYLQSAYSYTEKDAKTLSIYITIYNAVHRGNMDMFNQKYKSIVRSHLKENRVGLSVHYKDWPGQTQIVIPLSEVRLAGTISSISTTILTEQEVVEKIKDDDQDSIEIRKDMVELKETEQKEAEQRLAKTQEELSKAQETIEEKQTEAREAKTLAEQAQKEAEETKKRVETDPEDSTLQEIAKDKQVEAEKLQEIAEKKEQELEIAEEDLKKIETDIEKEKIFVETKQKETIQERKEIASDIQKEVDSTEAEKKKTEQALLESSTPAVALRVVDEDNFLSDIMIINLSDGKKIKHSSLSSIRNRTLIDTGTNFMAIAGKKGSHSAIRLVLIENQSLEMISQGEDDIAEASMLVKYQHDYYAVIEQTASRFVLGRFDASLQNKAKSAIEVKPYTPITVTDKGILVQNKDNDIVILRSTDLVEIK